MVCLKRLLCGWFFAPFSESGGYFNEFDVTKIEKFAIFIESIDKELRRW